MADMEYDVPRLKYGPCPDGGQCHHECVAACWRVLHAGPLSGVFEGNCWPRKILAYHGADDPEPELPSCQQEIAPGVVCGYAVPENETCANEDMHLTDYTPPVRMHEGYAALNEAETGLLRIEERGEAGGQVSIQECLVALGTAIVAHGRATIGALDDVAASLAELTQAVESREAPVPPGPGSPGGPGLFGRRGRR